MLKQLQAARRPMASVRTLGRLTPCLPYPAQPHQDTSLPQSRLRLPAPPTPHFSTPVLGCQLGGLRIDDEHIALPPRPPGVCFWARGQIGDFPGISGALGTKMLRRVVGGGRAGPEQAGTGGGGERVPLNPHCQALPVPPTPRCPWHVAAFLTMHRGAPTHPILCRMLPEFQGLTQFCPWELHACCRSEGVLPFLQPLWGLRLLAGSSPWVRPTWVQIPTLPSPRSHFQAYHTKS